MATWKKEILKRENGEFAEMQVPVLISASRSTDIPAFYCDWFFHRLKVGYSAWTNPFNGVRSYVSYKNTRFIVFWSKNPKPLLAHLDELRKRNIKCYVQYTLNDYVDEMLEKGVPSLAERIDTFKSLVAELGKGGVVWRFDPLILTDKIDENLLLYKIEKIGDQLKNYAEKLVFSFVDVCNYKKVEKNLRANNISASDWTLEQMKSFAQKLVELNRRKRWNFTLATCGEAASFEGIEHNHCIDDELIIRRAYNDKELMSFLKAKIHTLSSDNLFGEKEPIPDDAIMLHNGFYVTRGDNKDKGQRIYCGCIKSKDIGQYDTCIHSCEYCYANTNKEIAQINYEKHNLHPLGESII